MNKESLLKYYKILFNKHRIPFLITIIILCTLLLIVLLNGSSTPGVTQRSALRVQAVKITPVTERVKLSGFGTIEPSKLLEVYSQVSGHVTKLHPQFEEGGRINTDDTIVQLDTADYELALETQKANVAQAENALKLESGNQQIAKYEYELFKKDLAESEKFSELALRKPQLKDREVALQAAKTLLKKAALDLERTTIKAPFPALVIERNLTIGTLVNPGSVVAQLASVDSFFIKVRIPAEALDWIVFDTDTGLISSENKVKIIHEKKGGDSCSKDGIAERVISNVDSTGKMVQLLVSIPNPLVPNESCAPFLLGSYVRVDIEGKELSDVIKIPRKAIREQNQIYIADAEGRLRVKTPETLYETADAIWVRNTFKPTDRVVMSDVQIPLDGMKLEVDLVERSL